MGCCAGCGERRWSTGAASSVPRCKGSRWRLGPWTAWPRSSGTGPSAPPRSRIYRQRFEHHGHGRADQAIVGLGGQVFMRRDSQDAVAEFRAYFDNAPVYGHGPSLEDFTAQTPLTVGSPQQVIERTLGFREYVGDYQRQLFLI